MSSRQTKFNHEEARSLFAQGDVTQAELARRYGVAKSTMRQALGIAKRSTVRSSTGKNRVLGASVTEKLYKQITREADLQGKTKSEFISELIEKYLEENGLTPKRSKGWRRYGVQKRVDSPQRKPGTGPGDP